MDIKSLLIDAFLVDESVRALGGLHEARQHVAEQTKLRPIHIDVAVPKLPDDDWLRQRVLARLARSHAAFVSFRYEGCIWCVLASDVSGWAARHGERISCGVVDLNARASAGAAAAACARRAS